MTEELHALILAAFARATIRADNGEYKTPEEFKRGVLEELGTNPYSPDYRDSERYAQTLVQALLKEQTDIDSDNYPLTEEDNNEWQETENERIKVYERTKALLAEKKHILVAACTELIQAAYDKALSVGYERSEIQYLLHRVVDDVDTENEAKANGATRHLTPDENAAWAQMERERGMGYDRKDRNEED